MGSVLILVLILLRQEGWLQKGAWKRSFFIFNHILILPCLWTSTLRTSAWLVDILLQSICSYRLNSAHRLFLRALRHLWSRLLTYRVSRVLFRICSWAFLVFVLILNWIHQICRGLVLKKVTLAVSYNWVRCESLNLLLLLRHKILLQEPTRRLKQLLFRQILHIKPLNIDVIWGYRSRPYINLRYIWIWILVDIQEASLSVFYHRHVRSCDVHNIFANIKRSIGCFLLRTVPNLLKLLLCLLIHSWCRLQLFLINLLRGFFRLDVHITKPLLVCCIALLQFLFVVQVFFFFKLRSDNPLLELLFLSSIFQNS